MLKVFDCSNSIERPSHRGHGGPIENDILRYLKQYCSRYNCSFVDDVLRADVLITNDIFPSSLINMDIPKVKRMDGVFFQEALKNRNDSLNYSAESADHVIFISEFSKNSFFNLYRGRDIKKHSVVLNRADPSVFFPQRDVTKKLTSVMSSATDWAREEKRFLDIISFAEMFPSIEVLLIGSVPSIHTPKNIKFVGYLKDPQSISEALNSVQAFINFSYKDACPKTVAQANACGLPILYADSGGVPEQVFSGIPIKDTKTFSFEKEIPRLNKEDLLKSSKEFIYLHPELSTREPDLHNDLFEEMLEGYFKVIRSF